MEPDIPEILRSTATNMSELFNMLARKVEMLEQENLKMREELAILKNEKHQ
jgi:hypothetical protein